MKINENKIISAISEGLKQALNEISDETIRAAADKAGKLGYHKYLARMDSYLNSKWKVFKKFAFPKDSVYGLLVEDKTNTYDQNTFLIVIGITKRDYEIYQFTFKLRININNKKVNESFVDAEEEITDINLSNNKRIEYICELLDRDYCHQPILIKDYFDSFDFYEYIYGNIFTKNIDSTSVRIIEREFKSIPTNADTSSTMYKGPSTIKKILLKIIPTFNRYTGFNLNYKTLMDVI